MPPGTGQAVRASCRARPATRAANALRASRSSPEAASSPAVPSARSTASAASAKTRRRGRVHAEAGGEAHRERLVLGRGREPGDGRLEDVRGRLPRPGQRDPPADQDDGKLRLRPGERQPQAARAGQQGPGTELPDNVGQLPLVERRRGPVGWRGRGRCRLRPSRSTPREPTSASSHQTASARVMPEGRRPRRRTAVRSAACSRGRRARRGPCRAGPSPSPPPAPPRTVRRRLPRRPTGPAGDPVRGAPPERLVRCPAASRCDFPIGNKGRPQRIGNLRLPDREIEATAPLATVLQARDNAPSGSLPFPHRAGVHPTGIERSPRHAGRGDPFAAGGCVARPNRP